MTKRKEQFDVVREVVKCGRINGKVVKRREV
jgi:hypothetical protein